MSDTPATSFLSTQQINELVERFRTGDRPAAELLLHHFQPYLGKWLRLLTTGRWDRRDREVRHFLSMLGSVDVGQTALILAQRLRAYERDDLLQEVRVALLETVLRYGNVTAMYRMVLKRRLADMTHDPLTFGYHAHRSLADVGEVESNDPPEINEAWVAGLTCGPGFAELTDQERRVLQLTKWYGYSVERTAEIMDCSISTITRSLRRARAVLKVHYLD